MTNFHPKSIKSFRFVSCEFDEKSSTAKLHYALDQKISFTEEYTFPNAILPLDLERKKAVELCLQSLHLMAGISYYKAAVPPQIIIENKPISESMAYFFEKIYLYGLGEFAHINNLDLRNKIHFPFDSKIKSTPSPIKFFPTETIVPVGGGKDSVVSIEALKSHKNIALFSVGTPKAIEDAVAVAALSHIAVIRRLSPNLFKINSQGALNGHVPISAIIAFTLALASILYKFDTVAMSNERSASTGNFTIDDFEVNHQYSKSLTFEKDIAQYFQNHLLRNFRYFSLLRPLSELEIARQFSRHKQYHSVFTSCNAAFRIYKEKLSQRWCLNCPKCRFVFLALAPFMEKKELLAIFGANLLDDKKQQDGFDALIGYYQHKPFECVGEIEESLAAFVLLGKKEEWKKDFLVQRFCQNILTGIDNTEKIISKVLQKSKEHLLPQEYEEILDAYLRT